MLPNYDASSVATVMGIAFQRSPAAVPGQAVPRTGRAPASDFDIRLDDATLQVVEAAPPAAPQRRPAPDLLSPPSPRLIEKAVERGLPRQALRHVAEALAGGDTARVAALEWGVVPKTTLDRRTRQLSPQESERTERVARLFVQARRALGTEAEAREFMTAPHPLLDGRTPLEAARTDLGTRRAEQILNALEYGLAL